ncbi:MAG: cellulose synthase family protein, partial [Candidatus Angelobacter sp.]
MPSSAIFLAFFASRGIGPYLRQHFLDTTFKGLYQPNAFDMMLLIPYFIVLILLASYGVHRYILVYLYYKHRKKKTTTPSSEFPELPRVTVQLPIFNEQYVVDRLLSSICKLQYPLDKLDIQLLDDSTDETQAVARALVEQYAAQGFPVSYLHRTNREGYKAGALAEGMKTAKGEFIAIFDADFTPPEDFLLKTVHHLTDPSVGMVQTRWTHINRNYSFLTEVEAILLDGHFVLEHSGRARSNVFFNFNGTAGVWRRTAIEEAGGWQHDTLTEDTDLSYRAQMKGWKFVYLQDVECPAELPVEMTAFKTQQARWAKGLIQTAKKILPDVLKSKQSFHVKLEAWYHLTSNLSYPLMVLL